MDEKVALLEKSILGRFLTGPFANLSLTANFELAKKLVESTRHTALLATITNTLGAVMEGVLVEINFITENREATSNISGIANVEQLLDRVMHVREVTGKPVGVKTAVGGTQFVDELCAAVQRRGLAAAPDFLVIDGGEGGSGAAPQALADHVALPIAEALPIVVDALIRAGLRARVRVVASGKLVTSAKVAWALAAGADFVNTARGFMFSLGCIQAMRCHQNTCPVGVTTHNPRLQRGLVVEDKAERAAHYAEGMNREVDMIAHACGLPHARGLRREHVRIVQSPGRSVPLSMLHPYPATVSVAALPTA